MPGASEFRLLEPARQRTIVAGELLGVDQHAEALVETERRGRGIALLREVGVGDRAESETAESFDGMFSPYAGVPVGNRPDRGRCHGPDAETGRIVSLERHAIEAVLEHRLHMAKRPGADGARPPAGRLDAVGAVLLREPQHAETGPIALLGVRTAGENLLDQRGGVRPRHGTSPDQARRTPLQMRPVSVRHVLRDGREAGMLTAAVHPDPRASLKDFDSRGREAEIDVW
jgi:hypothetical protein